MTWINPWMGVAGLVVLALATPLVWIVAGKRRPMTGTRLANTLRFAALPSFRKVAFAHSRMVFTAVIFTLVAGIGASVLAARPAEARTVYSEKASRDVVLCLDISGSMFPVDAGVIAQFRDIIQEFEGERVGLSWFNSSSVTLFPLTDDYEFIDATLRPLEEQLTRVAEAETYDDLYDIPFEDWPDTSGTLLGNGSSLPGDGLASCLMLFDDQDSERPRSVVLATDNQLFGKPIFDLSEAIDMAAEADVRVYSLCPEDSAAGWIGGTEVNYSAFRELEEESVRTGGGYFTIDDPNTVAGVVEGIMAQEAAMIKEPAQRVVSDRPAVGTVLLAIGVVGLLLTGGWKAHRTVLTVARRVIIGGLVVLVIWNPPVGSEQRTQTALEADVIVLVDTSPSLAAEDWNGDEPRTEGVIADLRALAEHHAGAHFSIIAVSSHGRYLLPPSASMTAVAAATETLTPEVHYQATGTSIDSGLDLLMEALEQSAENHPERARLVYYLGDGEQTSGKKPKSFKDTAKLIDGGAVLGYGTKDGGRMLGHVPTYDGTSFDTQDYIPDWDNYGHDAISVIDQKALEKIADQMGVSYHWRTADRDVTDAFWQGDLPERPTSAQASVNRPIGPWLAVILFPLLIWELAHQLVRMRRASGARKAAVMVTRKGWQP
ncbi:MAG: VWA domain-containing protein [Bifidobacteriaceae bacterium]|jgi:Mg-chelatase subunit ChlD|nr:VWA domain-containing protein [Bifidobacteriaceae bacterium]